VMMFLTLRHSVTEVEETAPLTEPTKVYHHGISNDYSRRENQRS
jgi:hypothetical protein